MEVFEVEVKLKIKVLAESQWGAENYATSDYSPSGSDRESAHAWEYKGRLDENDIPYSSVGLTSEQSRWTIRQWREHLAQESK